jgi:hypothetical protein
MYNYETGFLKYYHIKALTDTKGFLLQSMRSLERHTYGHWSEELITSNSQTQRFTYFLYPESSALIDLYNSFERANACVFCPSDVSIDVRSEKRTATLLSWDAYFCL